MISATASRNLGCAAVSSHSNTTISAVTTSAPCRSIRRIAVALSSGRREPGASRAMQQGQAAPLTGFDCWRQTTGAERRANRTVKQSLLGLVSPGPYRSGPVPRLANCRSTGVSFVGVLGLSSSYLDARSRSRPLMKGSLAFSAKSRTVRARCFLNSLSNII